MIDEKKLIEVFKKLRGSDTLANMFISDVIKLINEQPKVLDSTQNVDGWISCSERLPENIQTVIVQVKEIKKPTFAWYGNMSGWRLVEKDFLDLKGFTVEAWQPLPEPYKEE